MVADTNLNLLPCHAIPYHAAFISIHVIHFSYHSGTLSTRLPNDLMLVDATPNAILVSWPLIDGAALHSLTLTHPDGNELTITRTPQQAAKDGSFFFIFTGLQPGTMYDLSLTVTDEKGVRMLRGAVSVTTKGGLITEAVVTPSEAMSTVAATTETVSTQAAATEMATTQATSTEVVTQVASTEGVTTQATTTQLVTTEGVTTQGVTTQGVTTQGVTTQGMTTQAVTEPVTTKAASTQAATTESQSTQAASTQQATTDRSPNALMIVEATPNTILVSWPVLPQGDFYQLVLTHPDGREMVISRTSMQAMDGQFYFVFNGLQPDSTYVLALNAVDGGGREVYQTSMNVTTPVAPTTESVMTTEIVTTKAVSTERLTTQALTTERLTTPAATTMTERLTTQAATTQRASTKAVTSEGMHFTMT